MKFQAMMVLVWSGLISLQGSITIRNFK